MKTKQRSAAQRRAEIAQVLSECDRPSPQAKEIPPPPGGEIHPLQVREDFARRFPINRPFFLPLPGIAGTVEFTPRQLLVHIASVVNANAGAILSCVANTGNPEQCRSIKDMLIIAEIVACQEGLASGFDDLRHVAGQPAPRTRFQSLVNDPGIEA